MQIIAGLVWHVIEFEFYPKNHRKLFKGIVKHMEEWGTSHVIKFAFEKGTQAATWRMDWIGQRQGVKVVLNS